MAHMPSVAEGDERVTLQRILEERSDRLSEREVWAICKEACAALLQLSPSGPIFQQLCITPDSLAFDSAGNICFLLLSTDPDPMFRSPEYEAVGNTIKSHLFSLGMTIWLAVQYSGNCSSDLRRLLADMTGERYEDRPDERHVQAVCERALHGMSADIICNEIAAAARWDSLTASHEGKASLLSTPSSQLSLRMQQMKIVSPVSSSGHSKSSGSGPRRALSLGELVGSGRGLVRSSAECLALLREAALAAVSVGPGAALWRRGLSISQVCITEEGVVVFDESATLDSGRELLQAPEMAAGGDLGNSRLSWERAAVFNLGSIVCRLLDDDEDAAEPLNDEATALLMSTVRQRPTQRPGLHQLVRACDDLSCGMPGPRLVLSRMLHRTSRSQDGDRPRAVLQKMPPVEESSPHRQSNTASSSSSSAFRPVPTSAPNTPAAPRKQPQPASKPGPAQKGLPEAYTSPLTHFRPIVIRSDAPGRSRLTQPTLQETSRKLAERLRQIRDQPKRPPAQLAAELEASLLEEEEAEEVSERPVKTEDIANTQFQLVCDPNTGLYSLLPAGQQQSSPHAREAQPKSYRLLPNRPNRPTRTSPSRSGTGSGSHSSRVLVTVGRPTVPNPQPSAQHVRFRSNGQSGEERESRDSGVSTGQGANSSRGPNPAGSTAAQSSHTQRHYPTPMERLLSTDSLRYQQTLTRLIHMVQQEFAFDGYMENGIEDLSLAEYIISLVNLKWPTFSNAIRERYCDLYWSNQLLSTLFEVVNGRPPDLSDAEERRPSPLPTARSLEALGPVAETSMARSASEGELSRLDADAERAVNAEGVGGQSRLHAAAVYHAATVAHFHKELAPDQLADLPVDDVERQAREVDQQIAISRKQFKRTLVYKEKMMGVEVTKAGRQEHKLLLAKMDREVDGMRTKLQLLENSRRKLEVLLSESRGVDLLLLPSLVCSVKADRLSLKDRSEELATLLQFHREQDLRSLQSGQPVALMACLFLRGAVSSGFIQHFFFCYRYFATPAQLLAFIAALVRLAADDGDEELAAKVMGRACQLCAVWIGDFFSIDFQERPELSHTLIQFVREELTPRLPPPDAALLSSTLSGALSASPTELLYPLLSESDPHDDAYRLVSMARALSRPSLLGGESRGLASCLERKRASEGDLYLPRTLRRADNFSLADYSCRSLAELLTSVEQACFQRVHPCHFLDTGTGAAPSGTPLHAWLQHCRLVAHWAVAEVVTAASPRLQADAITRLLGTARCCADLRNFATCAALLEGLDSPRLAWAPAWQGLAAKWVALRRQLAEAKLQLGSQRDFLLAAQTGSHLPTIPHPDAFLLHVRQTEIGSFTTTSGLVKWAKVRSVAQLVDQIRLFKQYRYQIVAADNDCLLTLRDRMDQLFQLDLDTLQAHAAIAAAASNPAGNTGRWAFLRRMKAKFSPK